MSLLHFTRAGQGNPLVLQHGYLGSSEMWSEQFTFFKSRYDVIAAMTMILRLFIIFSSRLKNSSLINFEERIVYFLMQSAGKEDVNIV